jgi:type VI secretion system protein ImpC
MTSDWTPDFGGIGRNPPNWKSKRPMRIALLGDFGGGALSGRLDTGAALAKRKPLNVEFDSLEDAMARLGLTLRLPLGTDGAPVDVNLTELESFHPDELYRNLEIFSALASLRKKLNNPATFAAAAASMKDWAQDDTPAASRVGSHDRARGASPSSGATLDDFARLTGRPASRAAETSIDALLRSIVSPFVVPSAAPGKDALVASVDKALADAMRAVLHQPDFQNIESLWRGVDFLLRRIETSHQLQVHLIDISAEEFAADLSSVDDLADSGLYKLLVERPSEDADGGYSHVAGCFLFDATPPHAELLGRAARVCAHAGAPFITAIDSGAFTDRRKALHRLVQEAFEALRGLPEASYLALLAPRFLLRHPYGKASDPISSFAFEEFTPASGLRGMLWGHPALLALSVLATRDAPLTIGDLPFHHFRDADGDSVALPCTERLLGTDAAVRLRDSGINALLANKGAAQVRLAGLEAINGDRLASSTDAPRKAPGDSRATIGTAAGHRAANGGSPSARPAGTVAMAAPIQQLDTSDDDTPATDADETPADDDLAALLASLGATSDDATDGEDTPTVAPEEGEMDPDLKALLASLG